MTKLKLTTGRVGMGFHGNSAFLIPNGIHTNYPILPKGFILLYTLYIYIGKLRPKEVKGLV